MMATSSAIQLADLALTWSTALGNADLSLIDMDLASDRGLTTAAALSLFTDRRAEADDVPPSGDPTDRRGFWADEFADVPGDRWGSRLWLLDRAKATGETRRKAREYALEALAWMVEDKVITKADVTVEAFRADGMELAIVLEKPDGSSLSFRFSHVWDHQE